MKIRTENNIVVTGIVVTGNEGLKTKTLLKANIYKIKRFPVVFH